MYFFFYKDFTYIFTIILIKYVSLHRNEVYSEVVIKKYREGEFTWVDGV